MLLYESTGLALVPKNEEAFRHCLKRKGHVLSLAVLGHSLAEHAFIFGYLTWCFKQLKADWEDPEVFRYQVSLDIDHVEIIRIRMDREQILKLLEQGEKRGGWVDLRIPKSWSFGKSHFKEFHDVCIRVGMWGEEHTGIGLDEWKRKNPHYRSA